MSEEQNWKERVIGEYIRVENEIAIETREMDNDSALNQLLEDQANLNKMVEAKSEKYVKFLREMRQQQANLKDALESNWDIEDKTFKCDAGAATLRTTKSLHIYDKKRLIEFLTTLNILPDFIKTFEIGKLRKIKGAGLIEDSIANWDETKSVIIKGVDQ